MIRPQVSAVPSLPAVLENKQLVVPSRAAPTVSCDQRRIFHCNALLCPVCLAAEVKLHNSSKLQ